MANGNDNPYESPAPTEYASWVGKSIALVGILIAAVPSCLMLYWLTEHFVALSNKPSTSYRPILGIVGWGLSLLCGVVLLPFPLLAGRFGTNADRELALIGMCLVPLPILLGLLGPVVVCWATGSSFGS